MTHIYYEVPILDDEGNQFAEFDAKVHFNIELENGEPLVCIEQFDVDVTYKLKDARKENDYKNGSISCSQHGGCCQNMTCCQHGHNYRRVKNFSSRDDDACLRTLFLRGKEMLEQDEAFINAALEADETIVFHGRGVHDPNGHYSQHDPNGHYI